MSRFKAYTTTLYNKCLTTFRRHEIILKHCMISMPHTLHYTVFCLELLCIILSTTHKSMLAWPALLSGKVTVPKEEHADRRGQGIRRKSTVTGGQSHIKLS